ncbi:hypothetical protein [Streptomyces sp. NRRL B-1347]|uniref:hypothetical protein n=1 Tax=Streptomyces sp. NRRL B-1347 TaxID=1476877 RepID=UPI00131C2A73|nr:hypothetical protein [Streptomyces sp. NRRL B-1347]
MPPVKRTVDRSGACGCGTPDGFGERAGPGLEGPELEGPELEGPGLEGPGLEGPGLEGAALDVPSAASALRTAPSSSGRLCAAPPPSALANCQAPRAPAAVPTATQAIVPAALHHFRIRPPSPAVP